MVEGKMTIKLFMCVCERERKGDYAHYIKGVPNCPLDLKNAQQEWVIK